MAQKKLREVLAPEGREKDSLRWQAAVPLLTNPFLFIEAVQFALAGAAIVLAVLCAGVLLTDGAVTPEDALTSLGMFGLAACAVLAGFAAVAILFFGNRYFAVYRTDESGLYYEGSRGQDGRPGFFFHPRAMPVVGNVEAARTHSRYLPWEKADRFQDIPSMRVISVRRGYWHLLRLYTPDAATHELVVRHLGERLKRI